MTTANYRNLELTAKFMGTRPMISDRDGDTIERHYRVDVLNRNNSKAVTFDFYPSIAHPVVDSAKDLKEALGCFVNDAYSASMGSIDDFAAEFGYTNSEVPISKVIDIFDACHDSYVKLMYLFDNSIEDVELLRDALESEGML